MMYCTTFIDKEISGEEFIKAIDTCNASFVAPLKCIVTLDDSGCLPVIFNDENSSRTSNYFVDTVARNIDRYSEKNNIRIVALAKEDVYTRLATPSETKMAFRQLSDALDRKELETFRWKRGSEIDGTLITDIDGKKYDFPDMYRWIKSVFTTGVTIVKPADDITTIIKDLYSCIDNISLGVFSKRDNAAFNVIHNDYTLIDVGPKNSPNCPETKSDNHYKHMAYFNFVGNLKIISKVGIPSSNLGERYQSTVFHDELEGYDIQDLEEPKIILTEHINSGKN